MSKRTKILIIGAGGQIGVELCMALRKQYGEDNVLPTDLKEQHEQLESMGRYMQLNAMDGTRIAEIIDQEKITQVYLLAAVLSATGEKNPPLAWDINMGSLLNLLNIGKEKKLDKIYWPSSIAVFGPTTPKQNTPQRTIIEPKTMYGITKYAGENLCAYYNEKFDMDIRGLRYPGLISYKSPPGGGTTDYAIDIFHKALAGEHFECFLKQDTYLPMMYMDDAIRATISLMDAPKEKLSVKNSYNVAAFSFSPEEIAAEIKKHIPDFSISYAPDYRQSIAESWPQSIADIQARTDWDWHHEYDLSKTVEAMLTGIKSMSHVGA
jgi:nucleoside-diphosphate-sugar epimerase